MSLVRTGDRYTFTTAGGKVREYVVENAEAEDGLQNHASIVRLRNVENDKFAQVTVWWLRRGRLGHSASHWTKVAA